MNTDVDNKNLVSTIVADELQQTKPVKSLANSDNSDTDGKKRQLMTTPQVDDGPLSKKIKAAKLDTLFGTEDVDLRTIPAQLIAVERKRTACSDKPTPATASASSPNWDRVKSPTTTSAATIVAKISPKKSPTLDDVRAKLAKAAKYNKITKFDNANSGDLAQRLQQLEPNVNEMTEKSNDDKIRTIIVQAQELLETNTINPDQYKSLVQTVVSINETSKLKEAKRRESLNNSPTKTNQRLPKDDNIFIEAKRLLARKAVLKKRIPKIPKIKIAAMPNKDNLIDGTAQKDKDISQQLDTADVATSSILNKRSKLTHRQQQRDDQLHNQTNEPNARASRDVDGVGSAAAAASAINLHSNVVSHATFPLPSNANLHLTQLPWQVGSAIPPPPYFSNNMLPALHANVPPPPQPPNALSLSNLAAAAPFMPTKPCNSIDNPQADVVRTITIDGQAKEIRIYDHVAIVFMEAHQPHEIGFQKGQRSIFIDNHNPITLRFNDEYQTVHIDGAAYCMRFGFPSRELYIDENWYEIYFGGPPVSITLANKIHILKAEGPPPQVNIGPQRRDLVVGKINMIVDAYIVVSLFLDAKKQTFFLHDKEHTIQFADNLLTVLLDGEAINVDYGGLPKSYILRGVKYFIRFGALPQGVVAGKVRIKDMIYVETKPTPADLIKIEKSPCNSPNSQMIVPSAAIDENLKIIPKQELNETADASHGVSSSMTLLTETATKNINIDELLQKLVSYGVLGASKSAYESSDKKPALDFGRDSSSADLRSSDTSEKSTPDINIDLVDLAKSDTIKVKQNNIIGTIFAGMQCGSCGVRFPPEQTIKYSQHLDWHFRSNRRYRDSSRKSHSRKWYFDLNDWLQYEEFEDIEEREKNFFETQTNDSDALLDDGSHTVGSPAPSCAALPEDVNRACVMCQEKFEQYYNEENEEWHLRSAIRVNDLLYHPLCHEDYMLSLNMPTKVESPAHDDNAVDIIIKIEGDETHDDFKDSVTIADDNDDDDVIVLPNEIPSITEIDDDDIVDDKCMTIDATTEATLKLNKDDEKDADDVKLNDTAESDVEIQEPNIPFTDLDAYEEKKSTDVNESMPTSFMNIKIKEEPRDDDANDQNAVNEDDDDDGFEDVGTVVIPTSNYEDLIDILDESHTQSLDSIRPSTPQLAAASPKQAAETETTEINDSIDDDQLEAGYEHNLSTASPAPTVPLGSLVNKIKINITKNIVPTTTSSNSDLLKTSTVFNSVETNINRSNMAGQYSDNVVSSIPVLCAGKTQSSSSSSSTTSAFVSPISVIGSYGCQNTLLAHNQSSHILPAVSSHQSVSSANLTTHEPTIAYTLKPALQKAELKLKKPIESGVETSGLCSIM